MQEITVGVEGMMCGMCENHVNECVRKHFSVKKVTSSHEKKRTVILAEEELDEEKLRAAIDETGYTVTSIETRPYEKKRLFSRKK